MVESVKDTVKARLGKIKLLASTEELKQLKSHQLLIFIKRLQIYVKTQQRLIHSLRRKQQVREFLLNYDSPWAPLNPLMVVLG